MWRWWLSAVGNLSPRWAGWGVAFMVINGGGGDDSARIGMTVRPAFSLGRANVVLVCSAMDVGSSCAAIELLVPYPGDLLYHHFPRRDGDGDCKTVVARIGGWLSLVVVLHCAWVFLWADGWEKSMSFCLALTRCRFRVTPFLPRGRRGKPPFTLF
jgi:hypothetical protein